MLQNDNVARIRKEQHIQRHGVVSNKALPSSLLPARSRSTGNTKLVRGFSLLIFFAVMYYGSLLKQLQSATRDKDADYDTLLWEPMLQTGGEKKGVITSLVDDAGVHKISLINNSNNTIDVGRRKKKEKEDDDKKQQHVKDASMNSDYNDPGKLPSAKTLLTSKPPFSDLDIITLYPDSGSSSNNRDRLIRSKNAIVTGYFRVPSKFKPGKYDNWMHNMLSLQDAMIIFTQPDLVDQIKNLRNHAQNRTVIVPLALEDLPFGTLFPSSFWQEQLDRDPEKRIHRSYQLFWIWLSKSWFVTQAIRMNIYDSDIFVWSDIGCFRERQYNSKTMIVHREQVPEKEMLQMAHHKPNPPKQDLFNDKYKQKGHFYHSGSQLAGYRNTWIKFHEYFLVTIDRFLQNDMIIVEDQAVLQSTCLSHPEICAYVPFNQVNDNHYFGLRYILHFGGKYNYWRYTKG